MNGKMLLSLNKVGFYIKKNSPTILTITGVVGAGVSVLLACKATTKLESKVKPSNEKLKVIREKMKDDNLIASGQYSVSDGRKDLTKEYTKLSWELVKLYGPTAITFGLSVASIVSSHNIMKGRNLALAASYTAIDKAYKAYRERVQNRFGEEVEKEIYNDIKEKTITKTVVDSKGKEKEVKDIIKVEENHDELNSLLFDESRYGWTKDGPSNVTWLMFQQATCNAILKQKGYMFLEDVFDILHIDKSTLTNRQLQASKVLGWLYVDPDKETPEKGRDNWISFGISDREGNIINPNATALLRSIERNIWLEFNFDGDILTGDGKKIKNFTSTYNRKD